MELRIEAAEAEELSEETEEGPELGVVEQVRQVAIGTRARLIKKNSSLICVLSQVGNVADIGVSNSYKRASAFKICSLIDNLKLH